MLKTIVRSLLFWLAVFESLALARGWRGLSWSGARHSLGILALLPLVLFGGKRERWLTRALVLALVMPAALVLHVAASSLRNGTLNPLLRLRPGRYDHAAITQHALPMREGHLPVLRIVPVGGACKAVCVLHGSGCDKTYYVWRMVDTLLSAGCAVLLVDLDGHGENARAQRFPDILEDAAVGVSWLRTQYERVGLIGVSLGGCIAARAVADGVAVDRLAVLEAPPALHYTQADVWREGFALLEPGLLELFADTTAYHIVKGWQTAPIRAAISTWDLIAQLDLLGALPRVDVPTLLLYGANDAIVKPAQAREVQAVLPANARFRILPRTSHLTLQLAPEALRELEQWFREM